MTLSVFAITDATDGPVEACVLTEEVVLRARVLRDDREERQDDNRPASTRTSITAVERRFDLIMLMLSRYLP